MGEGSAERLEGLAAAYGGAALVFRLAEAYHRRMGHANETTIMYDHARLRSDEAHRLRRALARMRGGE